MTGWSPGRPGADRRLRAHGDELVALLRPVHERHWADCSAVLASHPQVETTPLTAVVRGGAGEQWRTYDTALRALAAIESLTSIRLRPPQTQIQATIDGEIRWLPLDDLTTWWELPDTDQARSLRRRHCAHVYPNSTVRGISWGELVAAGATRVLRDWPSLVAAHITDYRRTAAARDRRMARLMVG